MPLNIRDTISTRIIDELSKSRKLSAIELQAIISKNTGCSTAAIYKELAYLLKTGTIIKEKKNFSLSLPWILSVVHYGQKLQHRYFNQDFLSHYLPVSGAKFQWQFRDLLIMDNFWNQLILTLFAKSQEAIMYEWVPRPWFALVHEDKEGTLQRGIRLLRKKVYMIVGGDGHLDKEVTKILSPHVYNTAFAEGPFHLMRNTYMDVIDDYVLTIRFDRQLTRAIDKFFNEHKTRSVIPRPQDFITLVAQKNDIKVQIENNSKKAFRLKKLFKEYFC